MTQLQIGHDMLTSFQDQTLPYPGETQSSSSNSLTPVLGHKEPRYRFSLIVVSGAEHPIMPCPLIDLCGCDLDLFMNANPRPLTSLCVSVFTCSFRVLNCVSTALGILVTLNVLQNYENDLSMLL